MIETFLCKWCRASGTALVHMMSPQLHIVLDEIMDYLVGYGMPAHMRDSHFSRHPAAPGDHVLSRLNVLPSEWLLSP